MTNDLALYSARPLKLKKNRAWRTYGGGKLIDEWQGKTGAQDGDFPEEWIASVITARNPGREHIADEGLSYVDTAVGEPVSLRSLIEADPSAMLGAGHVAKHGAHPGVLIKMLDSAERLTIQVHPDRETAERLFGSKFGKTEAWYIVGGREIGGEPPYVLFGFKPGVTRERWKELFDAQDIRGMIDSLHRIAVKPGDVFLVEGGVPHAIGSGCLLVEIQEPTDYTIRVERTTPAGRVMADMSCHQGLGFERMFECFHYENMTEQQVRDRYVKKPEVLSDSEAATETAVLRYSDTPYFAMNEIVVRSEYGIGAAGAFSSLIVLEGEGAIKWPGGELAIVQGEQLFVPAGVQSLTIEAGGDGPLRLMRCFPPE